MKNDICIQCGESRDRIRKDGLICGLMSNTEAGSELIEEYPRHRFKPYSKKEK